MMNPMMMGGGMMSPYGMGVSGIENLCDSARNYVTRTLIWLLVDVIRVGTDEIPGESARFRAQDRGIDTGSSKTNLMADLLKMHATRLSGY